MYHKLHDLVLFFSCDVNRLLGVPYDMVMAASHIYCRYG